MGCDIHAFSEVKINGKWNFKKPINIGRNYDLFSILANVRNGYVFSGVKTGEGFVPISEPKGVPSDCSSEYIEEVSQWDVDGHSHSWLTLKEIRSFDWGQISIKQGIISLDEYERIEISGEKPTSWCGGISGPNIVVVECDEADNLLLDRSKIGDSKIYVKYRWSILYSEHCYDLLNNIVPELQKLGDYEDVRIVFFFDN